MAEQPWNSDYSLDPPRPDYIPADYYWDLEMQAWYPPGGPVVPDPEAIRAYEDAEWEEKRRQWQEAQALKSKDPVSAALDVPPSWRKSLSAGVKREHHPLFPDDDTEPPNEDPTPHDSDSHDRSEENN